MYSLVCLEVSTSVVCCWCKAAGLLFFIIVVVTDCVISLSLSCSAGFLVGKEGPMIHSGAIIGAGVPQLRSLYFKWLRFPYPYFRSDRYAYKSYTILMT